MKKLLQGALLPFSIFASGLLLLGCEQANQLHENTDSQQKAQTVEQQVQAKLSEGNYLHMARDVADMQLKTGDYIQQLKQTHSEFQQAIEGKNQQQLQQLVINLDNQLTGLNHTLNTLHLKSQEIDEIRQKMLHSTEQALASPLLQGDVDLSKIKLQQVEQQMGNIQGEMLKLAAMLLPKGEQAEQQNTHQPNES